MANILPINAMYLSWFRDRGKQDLYPADILIYIMILSRADSDTLTCFPSIQTICDDCGGLDRRAVWGSLKRLEQLKYIEVKKSRGRPNVYFMSHFKQWKKEHG